MTFFGCEPTAQVRRATATALAAGLMMAWAGVALWSGSIGWGDDRAAASAGAGGPRPIANFAPGPLGAAQREFEGRSRPWPWSRRDLLRAEQLAWMAFEQGQPGAQALLLQIEAEIERHGVDCAGPQDCSGSGPSQGLVCGAS